MIISPKKIVWEKILANIQDEVDQVQQNWIDLTLNTIEKLWTRANGLLKNSRVHTTREDVDYLPEDNTVKLDVGIYDITFNEEINIPNWMCAMIFTRSTVNRWGNFITSGLYDAGYHGVLGAILHVNVPIILEKWVKLAQIVFSSAEEGSLYEWVYNTTKAM